MGGEKIEPFHADCIAHGSPLRGRGKVHDFHQIGRSAGITPAWAGKSRRAGRCAAASGDHPRVGGEKFMVVSFLFYFGGSPPRRRGKATINGADSINFRITPAWAGKSNDRFTFLFVWEDHPRMGGEKVMCNSRDGARLGSPPRGRGKDIKFTCNAGQLRITPA